MNNKISELRGLWCGKCVDNGMWVSGDLLQIPKLNKHGKVVGTKPAIMERTPAAACYYVDLSTLGEWAGKSDKNGTPIFEGNIVRTREIDTNGDLRYFPVVWANGAFWLFDKYLDSKLDFLGSYEENALEVIGNVYDNPELLKD